MEGWKFWWGVAAFFLGGLSTQLNGWLTYQRQRKDRADDAADAFRKRREEFELQHLVKVNQLFRDYVSACAKYAAASFLARLEEPSLRQRAQDAREACTAARMAIAPEVGFILDDTVREHVITSLSLLLAALDTVPTGPEPDLSSAAHAVEQTYERISARVRELYAAAG